MNINSESLGQLKPEEKVRLCIDMTDGCVRICADGIMGQFPSIKEEELIEKLHERLQWSKKQSLRSNNIGTLL